MIDRARCRDLISKYRSEGLFTPPSLQGTILSPSFVGGVNWGSLAFDHERQLILAAVNHVPMVATLVPREQLKPMRDSKNYPDSEFAQQTGTPYGMRREMLASPLGLPCTAPPWGSLAAVDLRRNAILWQVVLGSTRDSTPWFVPSRTIGMPNMGGPLVTAGGLVFIGAATDNYLRAFDVETGRELWKGRLPAGGQATPMSYEAGGRQYVVIAAGGHGGLKTKQGDYLIAFASAAGALDDSTNRFIIMRASRFGSTALLGCTALFITTAQAAERTGGRVEEVVVTGTREAEQLRDFAGSISLVKGDDVTLVGSTHHSEIMNRAPGTMIQRNSGEESLTAIRSPVLSGPGSCGTFLFLENSVPIRPTGFCNVNELFEVNSEQASSIEVLRGPAG